MRRAGRARGRAAELWTFRRAPLGSARTRLTDAPRRNNELSSAPVARDYISAIPLIPALLCYEVDGPFSACLRALNIRRSEKKAAAAGKHSRKRFRFADAAHFSARCVAYEITRSEFRDKL